MYRIRGSGSGQQLANSRKGYHADGDERQNYGRRCLNASTDVASAVSAGRRFQEGMVRGKKKYLLSRRIATDSRKLITVVGSGAGICCGKMSCGYCHQSMHHFVHHGQPLILTSLFKSSPVKSGEHGGDTAVATTVNTDHPVSTSVDSFDFVTLSTLSFSLMVCGSQKTEPYSTVYLTRAKYATSLHCFGNI